MVKKWDDLKFCSNYTCQAVMPVRITDYNNGVRRVKCICCNKIRYVSIAKLKAEEIFDFNRRRESAITTDEIMDFYDQMARYADVPQFNSALDS